MSSPGLVDDSQMMTSTAVGNTSYRKQLSIPNPDQVAWNLKRSLTISEPEAEVSFNEASDDSY